jgi:hypothetical protein
MATVSFSDPSVKGLHVGFEINEDAGLRSPPGRQIVAGGGTTGEIYEWAGGEDGTWTGTGIIVTGMTPGSTTSGTGGGDTKTTTKKAGKGDTLATYTPPDDDADIAQAKLIREEWDDYKAAYGPLEIELRDRLTSGDYGKAEVDTARAEALGESGTDRAMRDIERYGYDLTPQQQQSLDTMMTTGTAAGGIQAANQTRGAMQQQQISGLGNFNALGRGVQGQYMGAMSQANAMSSQRHGAKTQNTIAGLQQQEMMSYQNNLNMYNQQMAAKSSSNSFWGSLIGAGIGFAIGSDIRVKENIELEGEFKGFNVYSFNYKESFSDPSIRHIGLMAQEVEKERPDVVMEFDGVKYIVYSKLGFSGEFE